MRWCFLVTSDTFECLKVGGTSPPSPKSVCLEQEMKVLGFSWEGLRISMSLRICSQPWLWDETAWKELLSRGGGGRRVSRGQESIS